MILGEDVRTAGTAATLDDLFRRAGVRHPEALALADPPNQENFTDGVRRALSFTQTDRAISALAARLRGLGLQTDNVVAMQFPNTAESVVAFLAVLRAGMIAAPLPSLWRQEEIVAALRQVGAKAILTCSRIGTANHVDIAMQSAVELFPIRYVCGFGTNLPDGIVSLDDIFTSETAEASVTPSRVGPAAAHIAAITFNLDGSGLVPIARSHIELVAGGLEIFLETDAASDAPLLTTIPITSFAGLSVTLLPWLLCGGALHLHHGFDPGAFAAQCRKLTDGTLVLPAAAVAPIAQSGLLDNAKQTIVALWRAPERFPAAKTWARPSTFVDVSSFGEIGVIAARRADNGLPATIPLGIVASPHRAAGAPTVVETSRTDAGTLALRGRMVPVQPFPPASGHGHPPAESGHSYVDTGFACKPDKGTQTLSITAPPAGTISVGGYRFRQSQLDALIAQADPDATIVVLPDNGLGQRLAGTAADRAVLSAKLQAQGVNPLVLRAFLRTAPEAA